MEEWRWVRGHAARYKVSNLGKVFSCVKARFLRPSRQQRGHMLVHLGSTEQRYVHRLVLEAFVGPCPEGMECRHLNGNPADNRLDNLAWGTRLENFADRTRLGEHKATRGVGQPHAKLNEDLVRRIRKAAADGCKKKVLAAALGVSPSTVSMVVNRSNWAWVE